ncbi:hypothetical protein EDE04_6948 [Streptomyces sp. 2132.2]|nr:hypothetical protein EDE04_6948 [Streptomyces sp. 2132.2]
MPGQRREATAAGRVHQGGKNDHGGAVIGGSFSTATGSGWHGETDDHGVWVIDEQPRAGPGRTAASRAGGTDGQRRRARLWLASTDSAHRHAAATTKTARIHTNDSEVTIPRGSVTSPPMGSPTSWPSTPSNDWLPGDRHRSRRLHVRRQAVRPLGRRQRPLRHQPPHGDPPARRRTVPGYAHPARPSPDAAGKHHRSPADVRHRLDGQGQPWREWRRGVSFLATAETSNEAPGTTPTAPAAGTRPPARPASPAGRATLIHGQLVGTLARRVPHQAASKRMF